MVNRQFRSKTQRSTGRRETRRPPKQSIRAAIAKLFGKTKGIKLTISQIVHAIQRTMNVGATAIKRTIKDLWRESAIIIEDVYVYMVPPEFQDSAHRAKAPDDGLPVPPHWQAEAAI